MVFDFVLSKGMKIFIEDKIYALDISLSNRDLPDPRRKNTRSAPSIEAMESANERIYPILLGSENNRRNSRRKGRWRGEIPFSRFRDSKSTVKDRHAPLNPSPG